MTRYKFIRDVTTDRAAKEQLFDILKTDKSLMLDILDFVLKISEEDSSFRKKIGNRVSKAFPGYIDN